MDPALAALYTQQALCGHAQVIAQAALMSAEIAGMVAENQCRSNGGGPLAYDQAEFERVRKRYEDVLGYNAVITAFPRG